MRRPPDGPARIRHYQIEKVLARGGMATVYLARDTRQGRLVALKEIHPHIAEDPEFLQRFRHEVRIHSELRHPNVLEVHEVADGPDDFFIAMEYIDGGSLKFLLDTVPQFPSEIALFVTGEVLAALAFAHARGIVHRDVKPPNILITRGGEVKLADFGISRTSQMTKLTQTGNVIGTPAYMSPEQALGGNADARSDVFSTGVVLYEMLGGKNPFATSDPVTTIRKVIDSEPEDLFRLDPTIPPECEEIARRMLAKKAARRFASAEEALVAVRACLGVSGVADPKAAFRAFLDAPRKYVEERRQSVARLHLERGKTMLETKSAAPEAALWEIYQAHRADESSPEASLLLATVSVKTGYRMGEASENSKIRELEEKLKADPENVNLLLQLAKLYKLERDFISMMSFFLKLKRLRIADGYLANQIESLMEAPGTAAAPGRVASRDKAVSPAPAPASPWATRAAVAAACALALLAALGVRTIWHDATGVRGAPAARPVRGLPPESAPSAPGTGGETSAVIGNAEELAATGDHPGAIRLLETWLAATGNSSGGATDEVVLELAGLQEKVGASDRALKLYERIVGAHGTLEPDARAARGDLFRLARDGDAERDFRFLQDSRDPRWIPVGHYSLGLICERQNQPALALDHFETLARNYGGHDLANLARLEAARLRIASGAFAEARALAEDARTHSTVGGDVHQRAGRLLEEIQRGAQPDADPPAPPAGSTQ